MEENWISTSIGIHNRDTVGIILSILLNLNFNTQTTNYNYVLSFY